MKAGAVQPLHSLIKRSDFLAVQKTGQKCVAHGVIVQARPNDLGYIRIGYTVTKKQMLRRLNATA